MKHALKSALKSAGVKFVRIVWCDNANVIRAKAAHVDCLQDYIENGVGIGAAQMAVPVMYDSVVGDTGLGPVGEIRLMPDWSTLTILPFAPGHAQVVGDMVVGETESFWSHCPRNFLRRQIGALEEFGLTLKAVFENEFFLLSRNAAGELRPVDDTLFSATASMNVNRGFIGDLADALVAQGVEVEGYYPEAGPGQQEVNIRYAEAMRAADRQILYRETVRGVAAAHGLVASFLPKIFEDKAGSGCHLNFSLWREGRNIGCDRTQPTRIGSEAQMFLAGILEHLPALAALTIPSVNSYRRIRPHFWAGAFRCWGHWNREAAIRVCNGEKDDRAGRFELKTADATANPYIALGGLIAAGCDGMRRNLELPREVAVDPGLMAESHRLAGGVDPLPRNLGQSLEALSQDPVLLDALGDDLVRSFTAVRRFEWEKLKDLSLEEEVTLLVERY